LALGITTMREDALDMDPAEIDRLLEERAEARKARNFTRSDEIRDQLHSRGIEIMDTPDGTTWRKA